MERGKIRVFEAFAGYGSQSMALKRAGIPYEVVGISEIDRYAIEAYRAVHGDVRNYGDISKIDWYTVPDFDLFTYSFPCQDISSAGQQKGFAEGSGTRSGLLWECKKAIEAKKPKYLLMENVKNLVNRKFKPYFLKWEEWLREQGYTSFWKVLNAKDYGVPQNRERVFMVSILGGGWFEFPKKIALEKRLKDMLEEKVDEIIENHPSNKWIISKAGEKTLKMHFASINPEIAICVTARGFVSWNCTYAKRNNGKTTILSPREVFRLMGVCEEDIDRIQNAGISNSQQYKMAGNSIVVDVLEAIFRNLFLNDIQLEGIESCIQLNLF